MGFTDKPRRDLESVQQDPLRSYGVWPQPNATYNIQTAARPLLSDGVASEEPELSSQTLLATCGFLLVLLMVGFLAGYSLRGNANASPLNNSILSLEMMAVETPASLRTDSRRSKLMAMIGSQAPDELLAFEATAMGGMSALVRVHNTSGRGSDKLSLVSVDTDGSTAELLRQDGAGLNAMDMTRLANGGYVTASVHSDMLEVRGLDSKGRENWSRQLGIANNHPAEVKVVGMPAGTVILGPSETQDRISLTYLGLEGELIWHRSILADPEDPDLWIAPEKDASIFISIRNQIVVGKDSHTLMRIDSEGQDLWRRPVNFDETSSFAGLAAGDGAVYLLTSGTQPALTKYDASGVLVWDMRVPQAQYFSAIHLLTTSDGNAVIAVSSAVADERVDVWLEERGQDGAVIGETSLTLPGSSTIDAITEAARGRYLIAGSILPSRFEDTDIFVKDFEFKPVRRPIQMASLSLSPSLESDDGVTAAADPILAEVLPADTVTSSVDTPDAIVEDTETEDIQAPVEQERSVALASYQPESESSPVELDPLADRAAISRFITLDAPLASASYESVPRVRAQCRFSCLEKHSAISIFPMWRAIEAPQSSFDNGLPNLHQQTCTAAGGHVNLAAKPDCQLY